MTRQEEEEFLRLIDGKDISEIMALVAKGGNRYSRRILKFFRWFCRYAPLGIMLFHAYAIWDFGQHPREMFIAYEENTPSYLFIYFMLYLLPMVLILASRFFYLCWRYRIPFFYFFGVNSIHIAYWSWYTTNEMVMEHRCLAIMTLAFYLYGFADMFCTKTRMGRKICS